jgi:hypothetical protein
MAKRKKEKPPTVEQAAAPAVAFGRNLQKALPAPLDAEVLLKRGQSLVAEIDQRDAHIAKFEAARATMKADVQKCDERILDLKADLRRGAGTVLVDCREIPDFDRGVVHLVRLDRCTKEEREALALDAIPQDALVESRTMTEGERQIGMAFPEGWAEEARKADAEAQAAADAAKPETPPVPPESSEAPAIPADAAASALSEIARRAGEDAAAETDGFKPASSEENNEGDVPSPDGGDGQADTPAQEASGPGYDFTGEEPPDPAIRSHKAIDDDPAQDSAR